MKSAAFPAELLSKRAIIYVRQSSTGQVEHNLESQRRQYDMAALARAHGFHDVVTIDEDLGKSASGAVPRTGFDSMVSQVCQGLVGAVYCLEASRLARNGRDWHHLIELCGMVGARVVDSDGAYDPNSPNDRLLLGLKGQMSEFELTILRRRMTEAILSKAKRGELRILLPIGLVWSPDNRIELNPDLRIQNVVRTIFQRFRKLGTARRVLLSMKADGLEFPRYATPKSNAPVVWRGLNYSIVQSTLTTPLYAGAYVYGRHGTRTVVVDNFPRKSSGHRKPRDQWIVLKDHHPGYVTWEEYAANQQKLESNAFSKPTDEVRAARGGTALLSSLLRCRRHGTRLTTHYSGAAALSRHLCPSLIETGEKCLSFAARRSDDAVAGEVLRAVEPFGVEAALMALDAVQKEQDDRRRGQELEREQAVYEARLAQRRYQAVDAENRLVARELEAAWNLALQRVAECDAKLAAPASAAAPPPDQAALLSLGQNLSAAWHSKSTTMATKQQLLRTVIQEIWVDMDREKNEIVLVIHWRGGQHTERRVKKQKRGETSQRTSSEAGAIVRSMSTTQEDEAIAIQLNRMGLRTGEGNTWKAASVRSYRYRHSIAGPTADAVANRLTLEQAAAMLAVSPHRIRELITTGVLRATQATKNAPWEIDVSELRSAQVSAALSSSSPRRKDADQKAPSFPGFFSNGAQ